jgi:hypothetical protein
VYVYDFNTNQWTTSASTVPFGVSAHSVAVDDPYYHSVCIHYRRLQRPDFCGALRYRYRQLHGARRNEHVGRRHHESEFSMRSSTSLEAIRRRIASVHSAVLKQPIWLCWARPHSQRPRHFFCPEPCDR